jgi:hypothetical protein
MHLTPEQLVDIAEGNATEVSVPHLSSCAACRHQLEDLRGMMSAVADPDAANVPEPSPLFWTQFQRGVSERIAADESRWSWRVGEFARAAQRWLTPAIVVPAVALAVALIAMRLNAPMPPHSSPAGARTAAVARGDGVYATNLRRELLNDAAADDDPSLQLVAELTTGLDFEAAPDAGLVTAGSAEHAVTHLSDDELRELRRLLQQELGS